MFSSFTLIVFHYHLGSALFTKYFYAGNPQFFLTEHNSFDLNVQPSYSLLFFDQSFELICAVDIFVGLFELWEVEVDSSIFLYVKTFILYLSIEAIVVLDFPLRSVYLFLLLYLFLQQLFNIILLRLLHGFTSKHGYSLLFVDVVMIYLLQGYHFYINYN